MKDLKKKENPIYSQSAADLMLNWKKQLLNANMSNNDTNCKYEPSPISTNKAQDQSENEYNPSAKTLGKDLPKAPSSKNLKVTPESSSQKERDGKIKKRSSEVKLSNNSQEKRAKLSLNDYKSKKTANNSTEFDMFDAKSNNNENGDSSLGTNTGSCKYGFDDLSSDDENTTESYTPSPATKLENNTQKSPLKKSNPKSISQPSDKDQLNNTKDKIAQSKNMICPKPSTSLKDILENTKPEPYVPTSIPKAPVNLPRSATSVRPNSTSVPYVPSMQRTVSASQETVDEALSRIMKQKHGKRVLYTGKKGETKQPVVSSLYNLCARTLVDNLDALPAKISIYSKIITVIWLI